MKLRIVSVAAALVLFLPVMILAQADYFRATDQLPAHPRILLLKGEEQAITKAIGADQTWRLLHEAIVRESDELIKTPPVERVLTGRRLLGKSREALRRIFFLSYSFRLTGDAKYAKRAELELLAVSAFVDWNPSHFLDVAEMTMAVAIGYDWLQEALPEESKGKIRDAILHKGLEPSLIPRHSGWLVASHNWNQVCNAGMTYGALAVFEDQQELARKIINRSIDSIQLAMHDYGPDGAYPEGYGYWGYGTNFNVMFVTALEKLFGGDFGLSDKPGFLKTAGFLQNMTGPSNTSFNYSDSGLGGSLNPAMFWFGRRLNDYSLLWVEKQYLARGRALARDRLLPAALIWGAGSGNLQAITPPKSSYWSGGGKNPVALMRTSWTDPQAIFVGVKGGSPSLNHAHMDAGSFVMEADGVRWAMDFGSQEYNSLESKGVDLWNKTQESQRWQVFRYNNMAHNTLTIDGQLQRVTGNAQIVKTSQDAKFMHAQMDLSGVYEGQLKEARRGVAIVNQNHVVVRDELRTLDKETILRWTLLTPAEVKITGPNSAELNKNGRKLRLQVQEPAKVTMRTWSTEPTHDYDASNPGTTMVGFEATMPANSQVTATVLLLPEGTSEVKLDPTKRLVDWP